MRLRLENGEVFTGGRFGAKKEVAGEVVFSTGMVGYVESLSDPSYAGQILVITYPLIGNYGVPAARFFESRKIQALGLVVAEYSEQYSHARARESLAMWLTRSGVPAMTGVDTRALTKMLREKGVMLGRLGEMARGSFVDPNDENLVARVSPRTRRVMGTGTPRIVLVDCGAKENITRSLLSLGATVIRVPWDYDFSRERYDGLVLSNGPGNPEACKATIANIAGAMKKGKPIFGVCLGTQLLALATGAKTYKLKYGHRSQNQPCVNLLDARRRCYITSQNHGYAVDASSLPRDWQVWFKNANDGSVEGIRHRSKNWSAVQFHPEASPGPTDTNFLFANFIRSLKKRP